LTDTRQTLHLSPATPQRLQILCGALDGNLKLLEKRLGVGISYHGAQFSVTGNEAEVHTCVELLRQLYRETEASDTLDPQTIHVFIAEAELGNVAETGLVIRTPKLHVRPRGANQKRYVEAIRSHDINFGVGPAGTGKTYLAVACAVQAFNEDQVKRILLVRPAVEAGEKLGFCQETSHRRSIPICDRSTMPSTTCSASSRWLACWKRASSRSPPWPSCADARSTMPSSSWMKARTHLRSK